MNEGEKAMVRRGLAGCALGLLLLAGCSGSNDAPPPEDNLAADEIAEPQPLPEENMPAPPPEDRAAPEPEPATNVAEALPSETPPTVDEQMLEDAAATGMTARTTPDVVTAPPSDPVGAATNGLDSGKP